jgi:uncharacterized membrane protein YkgB
MNRNFLEKFDYRVISFLRKHVSTFARLSLFIIFFWFGILKVFGVSAAAPLVSDLLETTFLNFIDSTIFLIVFGLFEMGIGIIILIPKLERITFAILVFHLFTTILPLFFLPEVTWYGFFVPTLTGQYIIKNLALLSVGLLLFAHLRPMTQTHSILGEKEY